MLRTKRFQSVLDRLGKLRLSRPAGWFLLYVMPVAAAIGLYIFLTEFTIFFSPVRGVVASNIRGVTPLAYLGLPGINPYLPWVYGWIALVIAMVVHEGAHGVIARSLGLPVKSSGLVLLFVIPIGAFVEVDEDALRVARGRDSLRVLAGGAGVNFVLATVSLLLLFAVVSAMSPSASGIAITQVVAKSPAATAGIRPGDFMVAVNGVKYNDSTQLKGSYWYKPGVNASVTLWRHGQEIILPITVGARPNLSVSCPGIASPQAPAVCVAALAGYLGIVAGENVTFSSSGSGSFNSTVCVFRGSSCGVKYTPSSDSPQNITAYYSGDEQNAGSAGMGRILVQQAAKSLAQTASFGPEGYMGINGVNDSTLRGTLSEYSTSFLTRPVLYLCIPTFPQCQGLVPFSGTMSVFYSSPYGDWLIPLASMLYWLFFLNFNLAVFNALPLYPLDGGQAFRVAVQGMARGKLSERALTWVSTAAALAVVAVVFAVPMAAYLHLI